MNHSVGWWRPVGVVMAAVLMGTVLTLFPSDGREALAVGGTVSGEQQIGVDSIACGGAVRVHLMLKGASGIVGRPTDVMLVLDRSGSMDGQPMIDLKAAAKRFVEIMDQETDGGREGTIANDSRLGVVSFSSAATLNQPLTSDATVVEGIIDTFVATGLTNHEAAFQQAQAALSADEPTHKKVIVIFTDGQTTYGGTPNDDAAAAREADTEIFVIGIGNVDQVQLNDWASEQKGEHRFIMPSSADLQGIFEQIGAAIATAAATRIEVVDTIRDAFAISEITASKGSVEWGGNELTWQIDRLGTESVTLSYTATHQGTHPGGVQFMSLSIRYSDAQGNQVQLQRASVAVRGCAAHLALSPKVSTNQVGEQHVLIASVTDDFGDPVAGVQVHFSVTGGLSRIDGDPSAPQPSGGSGVTDGMGQMRFAYTNSEAVEDRVTAVAPVQYRVAAALSDTAVKRWEPLKLRIDIKPGSDPNSFGGNSQGVIPVALFSMPGFDVTRVDDARIRFGDGPTPLGDAADSNGRGALEDVDGDGRLDKVYHFFFPATHLDSSDTEGCLGGEIRGLDFLACDAVRIV